MTLPMYLPPEILELLSTHEVEEMEQAWSKLRGPLANYLYFQELQAEGQRAASMQGQLVSRLGTGRF